MCSIFIFFFFKQKTAYEMRISDWSSDVCSSDLKSYQFLAPRLCESADRSEVDKAHILFPDKENIAWMRIAMKFAIQNDHAQDCIRILSRERRHAWVGRFGLDRRRGRSIQPLLDVDPYPRQFPMRSEEHTSELQSLMRISYAVFCLK